MRRISMIASQILVTVALVLMARTRSPAAVSLDSRVNCVKHRLTSVKAILVSLADVVRTESMDINVSAGLELLERIVK